MTTPVLDDGQAVEPFADEPNPTDPPPLIALHYGADHLDHHETSTTDTHINEGNPSC